MTPMATGRLSRGRWKRRVRVRKRGCKGELVGTISVIQERVMAWKSWLSLLRISRACNQ